MGTLTSRAERALLGAMLRDPGLALRLGYAGPGDFELGRHRMLYRAITNAARAQDAAASWPQAVAAHAEEDVSLDYLGELAAACPDPGHGASYAALVLEASFQRAMREVAGDAGAMAETVSYDAARLTRARSSQAPAAAGVAGHMDRIALAIGRHAAVFTPGTAAVPGGPPAVPGDGRARNEEAVLGALISGHPGTRQILGAIGPAAFGDPLRRDLFTAARAADAAGHAIDPLTADWELGRALAWRGEARLAADEHQEESYAQRLAAAAPPGDITRAVMDLARRQPPRAAPALPAQIGDRALRPSPEGMTARQALASGSRLLQPPPEMNGNGPVQGPRR